MERALARTREDVEHDRCVAERVLEILVLNSHPDPDCIKRVRERIEGYKRELMEAGWDEAAATEIATIHHQLNPE